MIVTDYKQENKNFVFFKQNEFVDALNRFERNGILLSLMLLCSGSKDYHPGVYKHQKANKWYVQRTVEDKKEYGGFFEDIEEAKRASDALVHKYEAEHGKNAKYKLNFGQEANLKEAYFFLQK